MRPVKIVTDSCSDLPKELREKYDIDYMMMNTVKDGVETPADLDWNNIDPRDFYNVMRGGERYTTTMVPPAEFQKYFRAELEKGNDIVYIACSGKLSGSVNVGKVEAEAILKDYPDATIICVDPINACLGEGLIAIKAAQFRDQGMSPQQIVDAIMPICNNVNQFVTVHNLGALKAAGRVTGSSAFFGDLLGVKPIIISDKVGNNSPLKKVKGRLNSLKELANLTIDAVEGEEKPLILIGHADCIEEAEKVKEIVLEKVPDAEIHIAYIGPIIGASIGADAVGIFSFGKSIERFGI
ncbi:MAG: DegV family protein [Ruminococcus sp.]|nr:DegV family protein [Ruminococcus sp.]